MLLKIFSSSLYVLHTKALLTFVSPLLTFVGEGPPLPTLTLDRLHSSPPPRTGVGGGIQATEQSPCWAPRHLASPTCGGAGEPADPATCQLTHPRLHSSPCAPTWASVVRGDGACAVKSSSPAQQPAVLAAEFTALYDRCLASGLKARVVLNYAAGRQTFTVSCSFPVPAETSAAAGRRHCRHRRHRRRGRAATAAPADPARASPSTAPLPVVAMPRPATPRPTTPVQSPETTPPPVKKTRKRKNEVKLLRDCGEDSEILLSPPPSRGSLTSPPPSSPTSPPASIQLHYQPAQPSDQSSPEVPELLTLEPASQLLEPALPPEMPAMPPSAAPSPPTPTPMPTSPLQPASRPPASLAPANSSQSSPAGQPQPSPGYTVVFKWCPNCKKSLVDSREFECYTCQDRRYYYEEEWLGDWMVYECLVWMSRIYVF
jgi:hypothetical protein